MKKLMIVDDEFIVRVGIRSIVNWEEYGYEMAGEASSGAEALEKIARLRPDIVLTDLVMDNMDGFELIEICAEKYPEICFIVLSGYNDFENVRRAMKLGAKDYIFKPAANPKDILRILGEVADKQGVKPEDPLLNPVIKENIQAIKYNLLKKAGAGTPRAGRNEFLTGQFKALGLKVDLTEPYILLYIGIDDFARQRVSGALRDSSLIKSSMENIVYEVCGKNGVSRAEVFNSDGGEMALFISSNTLPENTDAGALFAAFREYTKRYLGLDVSGVISPVLTGTACLAETIKNCACTLQQGGDDPLKPYNAGQRNEIAKAKDYAEKHLAERFGVREVAAHVAMSENYFSHFFKKETGVSFIDYLNHVRMKEAAVLLEQGDYKMSEIAERVGMENPNYFSVLFKKVMGRSPQEYREAVKKKKNIEDQSKNFEDNKQNYN